MLGLALRTLRFRVGGFAASFIALFLGAAIVMACGGLMESGIRNAVAPQRLANAPLLVAGDPTYLERSPIPESLAARARVPGVAEVVPDVSVPLTLPSGDATGHLWSALKLTPYRVESGRAPRTADEVVVDAKSGAALDSRIALGAAGAKREYRVVGLLSGPVDAATAYFTDDEGRRLYARPGEVDLLGVLLEPGASADSVREALAGAVGGRDVTVLAGDERGLAEFPDAQGGGEGVVTLSAVFGGLAIMVAMFVVAGTLGLSVQQRHREMALLRAIGSTPGQLRKLVLGETAFVAVLATLLGWPLSGYLGQWLLTQLAGAGVAPTQLAYRQGWVPVAAGAGISILSALVAAFAAGRGAAVTKPTEALMESSLQSRWFSVPRLVFALVCLAGGTALSVVTALVMSGPVAASTAGPTAMLWASGIALLSPAAAKVIIALLRWPIRAFSGLAGYLAVLNTSARRVRVAGAITPVMLATGLATALIYLQTTQDGGSGGFADNIRADAVVSSSSGGLPAEVVAEAAALPGVEAASGLVDTEARFADHGDGDDEVTVLGVTPGSVDKTLSVAVSAGSLADLRGESVVLPKKWADELGASVGGEVALRLGDGQSVQAKVVAVHSSPYESVLMPVDFVLEHANGGQVGWVLVKGGSDALSGLTGKYPNLRVQDPAEMSGGGGGGGEQTGAWVNYLLVGMILAYTVISLVNTLVIATGERRREFALQRLIGATHGQILRMVGVEALVVTLGGVLLGGIVSLVTLIPFALAMDGSWWPSGPIGIYLTIIGATGGLTLLSTVLSTAYVLRTPPVEAAATLS